MRTKELEATIGGLSKPSKMPGLSYGLPAAECKVGTLLRKKKGTVCSSCYAHKGMYSFGNVQRAQYNRLEILMRDMEAWRLNMTALLVRKYARKKSRADRVFRWHDSGDLQNANHLAAIVQIAKDLPDIQFWLPTKEYALIRDWVLQNDAFPFNLLVRVSSPSIGTTIEPPIGALSSTVGYSGGFQCPASTQGNECGDCRACWDPRIGSVNYKPH